jgi:LysR family transcriptional regulator, regulator for genes of the gallate degradation pathway
MSNVVDGHYEALFHDLRAGKLDLLFGVLRRPDWAFDVKEEVLFPNPYVVVARRGHPLGSRATLRLDDLDVMSVSRARRAPVAGPREAVPPEFR